MWLWGWRTTTLSIAKTHSHFFPQKYRNWNNWTETLPRQRIIFRLENSSPAECLTSIKTHLPIIIGALIRTFHVFIFRKRKKCSLGWKPLCRYLLYCVIRLKLSASDLWEIKGFPWHPSNLWTKHCHRKEDLVFTGLRTEQLEHCSWFFPPCSSWWQTRQSKVNFPTRCRGARRNWKNGQKS